MSLAPPPPSEPVTMIPAAMVHAALLAGMHAICFAEPWNEASMAEVLCMPGTAGMIAVEGDSLRPSGTPPGPAGLVLWRRVADESEILTLAVLPPWRRRGIGGRLLTTAMAEAAAQGAATMFLEVAADNDGGLALYRHHGFTAIGTRKGYYGGTDAVTMRCRLNGLQ